VTGFGQTGPYRERAGYDYAIQGMGGLMSVTGPGRHEIADDAPGGGPQKVGVAVADLFTGLYATTAILAALRHRDRTGQGQAIDMALLDSQVAMLANLGAGYLTTGIGTAARRQCAPEHRAVPGLRRSPTAMSSWRWATMASTRASAGSPVARPGTDPASFAMPTGCATGRSWSRCSRPR
jgi:crotonobetainyl-CoA:carnitine CoA-transferase CaiB-like acyl-CoA transferase